MGGESVVASHMMCEHLQFWPSMRKKFLHVHPTDTSMVIMLVMMKAGSARMLGEDRGNAE